MHLAQISLILWFPIALALTIMLRPQRAIIVGYTVGWLFLPFLYQGMKLHGITLDKMMATSVGLLLSVLIVDFRELRRWRPHWVDIPVVAYFLTPILTAAYNRLGFLQGAESSLRAFIELGIPWFLGRIYLNNLAAVRDLAIAIFVGGILYVPLCLYEVRFSPQLQSHIYGISQEPDFLQVIRFNGYRPMVFMQHGLAVAMMLTAATLMGFWLWWTGSLRRLCGLPVWPFVLAILVTAILCKSVGALVLLAIGLGAILTPKHLRSYAIIIILLATPAVYCMLRSSGIWTGGAAVSFVQHTFGTPRAKSLEFRLDNETAIAKHALERPLLGWGPAFFQVEQNSRNAIPDGMWIIALGMEGIVGLTAFLLSFILPCIGFIRLLPTRLWEDPRFSAATGLVVFTALFGIDCLMNAMLNPNWTLAAGGLGTITVLLYRESRRAKDEEYLDQWSNKPRLGDPSREQRANRRPMRAGVTVHS